MLPYSMSVLHKIPPLVSALAFGYGVGMSAPESTISSVNAAVVESILVLMVVNVAISQLYIMLFPRVGL